MISNKNYSKLSGSIASLSNGSFVITCRNYKVYVQIYTSISITVSAQIIIVQEVYGSQLLVSLSNGNFVVSWRERNRYNSYIRGQMYDLTGAKIVIEFAIISDYYYEQLYAFFLFALPKYIGWSKDITRLTNNIFVSVYTSFNKYKKLSSQNPDLLAFSTLSACTNKPLLVNSIASGISLLNLSKNNVYSLWHGESNNNTDSGLKNMKNNLNHQTVGLDV